MDTMTERGFTPAAEAYCALTVAAKSPTMRSLFHEYDDRALSQVEDATDRLFASLSGAEQISVLPAYVEINMTLGIDPGRTTRGMIRDHPGLPRRVTNLDTGTEWFIEADTDITITVTKPADADYMDGCYVY